MIGVLLEHQFPNYSGFSHWRPFMLLPVYFTLALVIASIVSLVALLLGWRHTNSRGQLLILGSLCGLVPISHDMWRLVFPVTGMIPNLNIYVIACVFIVVLAFRYSHHRAAV